MELFELEEPVEGLTYEQKIDKAKRTLMLAAEMSHEYYHEPLIICYSGGKDSSVLLHLAETTLTKDDFEVLNSHTTVDAPETVRFIRKEFARLERGGIKTRIDYKKDEDGNPITMWNLIPKKKIAPTRTIRYCCQVLKETSTPNRLACLGVRAAESAKRQGRDTFGVRGGSYRKATFFSFDHTAEVHREAKDRDPVWDCTLIKVMRDKGDTVVNPCYEWTDSDVWRYIEDCGMEVNPLYERGRKRIGCLFCPLSTYAEKLRDEKEYPKYKDAYIRAFDRMLITADIINHPIKYNWKTGEDVFEWWIQRPEHECVGQMTLDDFMEDR